MIQNPKNGKKNSRKWNGASLAGVLLALLLIVVYCLRFTGAPESPFDQGEAASSRMYVTSSRLAMDKSIMADMENANAEDSGETNQEQEQQEDEEEQPDEEQEQEIEEDHQGLADLVSRIEEEQPAEDIPETKPSGNQEEHPSDDPADGSQQGDTPSDVPGASDGGSGSGGTGGNGDGGSGGNGPGGSGENEGTITFFATDIVEGTTVNDPAFSFKLGLTKEAVEKGYTLISNLVYVNGSRVAFQSGESITLSEGENTIKVSVRLRGSNFSQIDAPYQTYHVYYTPKGHVFLGVYHAETGERLITGDVKEVADGNFPVYVVATDSDGNAAATSVMLNRNVQSMADGIYHLNLTPGKNTLSVTAGTGASKQNVTVTINFNTEDFVLNIESQAVTQAITGDQFGGNTYVEYPSASTELPVRLTCSAGRGNLVSVVVKGRDAETDMIGNINANGSFLISLNPTGETAIRVTCRDYEGVLKSYTWRIRFIRNGGYGDEKKPSIQTNLVNEDLNVADFILTVSAVSNGSSQKQLNLPSYFRVMVNGTEISCSGMSGVALEYPLHFQEGANVVTVTATDDEQYSATKEVVVTYTPAVTTVNVSIIVDAQVLGLGQWVAETIPVNSNVTIAQILEERLAAHGFSTIHSGSATGGDYYLAHLVKPGITNGWFLSEQQRQYYEAMGEVLNENVPTDSLGEFDFTMNSGWMITLNGYFIGGGMGTRTVREGDVIRIQFTLNRGSDIGVDPNSDIYG